MSHPLVDLMDLFRDTRTPARKNFDAFLFICLMLAFLGIFGTGLFTILSWIF